MVSVEHPDPPEEAQNQNQQSGMTQGARTVAVAEHEVIIQRLLKKLCQIEVLRQRLQQGCELDATQREKLGREDELLSALEAALAVAATALAVPQTGPESPQKRKVQSTLDAQPHSARSSRMLAALAVPQTIRTESPQQPCATEAQLGPTSQHEEPCSDLVQRREELSALVQRPQQPRVGTTQTGPNGPQEHKEQKALVKRPQQSCAIEAQNEPNNQHKEQSAHVQRPQEPRVAETQIGPKSPRERPQQPRVAETQIGPESPREQSQQPCRPEHGGQECQRHRPSAGSGPVRAVPQAYNSTALFAQRLKMPRAWGVRAAARVWVL